MGENRKWLSDEKLQSSLKQIFKFTEIVIRPNPGEGGADGSIWLHDRKVRAAATSPVGRGLRQGISMFDLMDRNVLMMAFSYV